MVLNLERDTKLPPTRCLSTSVSNTIPSTYLNHDPRVQLLMIRHLPTFGVFLSTFTYFIFIQLHPYAKGNFKSANKYNTSN